jgi:hypothetical protein
MSAIKSAYNPRTKKKMYYKILPNGKAKIVKKP